MRRVNSRLQPVNTANVAYGNGWETNTFAGIIPRSCWTLRHRPKSAPEGMVYMGSGLWVDIYLTSDNGTGGLQSTQGQTPLTGTEGHNMYSFNDRLVASNKRLLNYDEWLQAAMGSPQGLAGDNTNAWTGGGGRQPAGTNANAVSSIGIADAVGNVWEWTKTFITRAQHEIMPITGNFAASDGGRGGQPRPETGNGHGIPSATNFGQWAWDVVTPLGDTTDGNPLNGNIFQFYDFSLVALLVGGDWSSGVQAGSRAVRCGHRPWRVHTAVGVRSASESL